ncbi:MAG: VCBS repeat-containing protein [Flavobacteriales bacterium]|nr:VCBS repeat-containing protein [Flavobacteriales bacterium]
MCILDLDNDGDLDICIAEGLGNSMRTMINNGLGAFTLSQSLSGLNSAQRIKHADLDLDGDRDLIVHQWHSVVWYANNGSGQFPMPPTSIYGVGANDGEFFADVVADIDGDGWEDFLTSDDTDLGIAWHRNRFAAYCRLQGRLYADLDADGNRDAGEPPIPWCGMAVQPGPEQLLAVNNGSYTFFLDSGNYVIAPVLDTVLWRISSDSAEFHVALTTNQPESLGNDFGITANADSSIVHLTFNYGQGPCGDTIANTISYANAGCLLERGIVALRLDSLHTFVSSVPPPDSLDGAWMHWHYDNLFFYEVRQIQLLVQRPDASHIGDAVNTSVSLLKVDSLGAI